MMINPEIFKEYCINRDDFDPEGLFVAIEDFEVVGMAHAGFAEKGRTKKRVSYMCSLSSPT